jgi:uncharacterized protein YjgD (DUF1641 family)
VSSLEQSGGDGLDPLVRAIEENPEAVADVVRRADAVAELLDAVELAHHALDDELVESLAGTGARLGELGDAAAEERTAAGLARLLGAVGEAEATEPAAVGTVGLLRATRDPEVRSGLGYLLALARAVGRSRPTEE